MIVKETDLYACSALMNNEPPMRVAKQSAADGGQRSERRAHLLVLSAIVILFLAFFGPTLVRGQFLVAGDAYYQSYPLRTIAWSAIRRGELPLWTPLIFSGYPLMSMAQIAIGYPLTWTYLFLPGHWAEQVIVLAPFLLAPAFTYAYAREVGRSHTAALLAGLAFTYGGNIGSKLGGLSLMTNSEIWLPLLLIAIERARRGNFIMCLLAAVGAYSMSVLAGQAQAFLLVGIFGLVYGVFVSATNRDSLHPWRPLLVAIGAVFGSMAVGAFQILETMRAARRSVRSNLSFEVFTAGAFTPIEAIRSFVAPIHHYIEASTYVAPLVIVLAILAIVRNKDFALKRSYIFFWVIVACIAFVLMIGNYTPVYRVLYHAPIFNWFRYPSRHALEWTLALSMLSAYGWDTINAQFKIRLDQKNSRVIAAILFGLCIVVALLWWRASFAHPPMSNFGLDSGLIPTISEVQYLVWKLIFSLLIALLFWRLLRLAETRTRSVMLVAAIMLGLFIEPRLLLAHVWFPYAKTTERFTAVPPVEQWLQQQAQHQRIYTRVNLFVSGYSTPPALDLPNMTAVRGLQNVAGYEQLILDRFSRALGDAGPDAVNRRYGVQGPPDGSLLQNQSHVLDILNMRYLVSFPHFATSPPNTIEKEGIHFETGELGRTLETGETEMLTGEAAAGDMLVLVTTLANSVQTPQGATVARVRIFTEEGERIDRELQAGRDTAEWAHERADVRTIIEHQLAPEFDVQPVSNADFKALRFWTKLSLGARHNIAKVEITNVSSGTQVALWKATVYDSTQKESNTLMRPNGALSTDHLKPVRNEHGVVVWENERALPRAWLVAEAQAVDGEEALKRIRGDTSEQFDPSRTALLEVRKEDLPTLPGGPLSSGSNATVVAYEPDRMTIDTDSSMATVLVLSEIFYPGWEAYVDGKRQEILLTDYLLRGVALPAGQHRIEMKYRAPAVRAGAMISASTLILLACLFVFEWRRRRVSLHE